MKNSKRSAQGKPTMKFRRSEIKHRKRVDNSRTKHFASCRAKRWSDTGTKHPSSRNQCNTRKSNKNAAYSAIWWVQRLESSKSFKNRSTVISYLQWKKYVSFAKRLNGKMNQEIVTVVAEKLCLRHTSRIQSVVYRHIVLVKVRSYNSISAFTSMGALLMKNAQTDKNLTNVWEGVYTFCVLGATCHRVGTLLPIESRITSSAQLYVFDSVTEVQVNMRCWIMDGLDREIVGKIQRVLSQVNSFVELFLRAGEIKKVLSFRLANHEAPGVDLRTPNRPTSSEVAAILLEDNVGIERDLILHKRGGVLQRNNDTQPAYDPLYFPLLFRHGELGWHFKVTPQATKNNTVSSRKFAHTDSTSRPLCGYSLLHRDARLFLRDSSTLTNKMRVSSLAGWPGTSRIVTLLFKRQQ